MRDYSKVTRERKRSLDGIAVSFFLTGRIIFAFSLTVIVFWYRLRAEGPEIAAGLVETSDR